MILPNTIDERSAELGVLHARIFADVKRGKISADRRTGPAPPEDAQIAGKVPRGGYGAVLQRLWAGDWSGYPSASEGELALCRRLAFLTGGDADQVDTLFRQSGLMRKKWDEPHSGDGRTYGQLTVAKAVEGIPVGVEPFPVHSLPESFRRFVEEYAAALAAPPDFVAVPLLVAAGAAIGDAIEIELKLTYREGPNLYAAIVGDPGSKKSPALTKALRPLYRIQESFAKLFRQAWQSYEDALAAWERANKNQRGKKPQPPTFRHLITTDATTEALAPMLLSSKGVLLEKDELTGWVKSMDQYRGGKGADRQHHLSMWSRKMIKVDRKSSPKPIIVPRPHLSVVGGIQPDLLPDLADAAQREDGFLDRLLWSFPDPVPDRWTRDTVSTETAKEVFAAFRRLYDLQPQIGANGEPTSMVVRLSSGAAERWEQWYAAHAAEREAPHFPRRLRGPWAKMPSQLARLTLILHALADSNASEVSAETLTAAIDLIDYFKSHARRVYGHLGRQRRDLKIEILQALREHRELSQSDLLRDVFKRNIRAADLGAALEQLEEAGLVTRRLGEPTGGIGRPPILWSVT